MFTHRYAGSQLARERNAKCWHKPASSTWCASSASTPRQAGAHSGRPRITRLLKRTRPATLPS